MSAAVIELFVFSVLGLGRCWCWGRAARSLPAAYVHASRAVCRVQLTLSASPPWSLAVAARAAGPPGRLAAWPGIVVAVFCPPRTLPAQAGRPAVWRFFDLPSLAFSHCIVPPALPACPGTRLRIPCWRVIMRTPGDGRDPGSSRQQTYAHAPPLCQVSGLGARRLGPAGRGCASSRREAAHVTRVHGPGGGGVAGVGVWVVRGTEERPRRAETLGVSAACWRVGVLAAQLRRCAVTLSTRGGSGQLCASASLLAACKVWPGHRPGATSGHDSD